MRGFEFPPGSVGIFCSVGAVSVGRGSRCADAEAEFSVDLSIYTHPQREQPAKLCAFEISDSSWFLLRKGMSISQTGA